MWLKKISAWLRELDWDGLDMLKEGMSMEYKKDYWKWRYAEQDPGADQLKNVEERRWNARMGTDSLRLI